MWVIEMGVTFFIIVLLMAFMFGWGLHAYIDYDLAHRMTSKEFIKRLWYKIQVRRKVKS